VNAGAAILLFFPTAAVTLLACGCSQSTPGAVADGVVARSAEDSGDALEKLSAIGYLQGYEPAPQARNITIRDDRWAHDGVNLVLSAHAPTAILMDMEGRVLHRWSRTFEASLSEHYGRIGPSAGGTHAWRRVRLLENGDLLAVFMNFGLIKIDRDSNLLWAYPKACHHDVFVGEAGEIYVLTRRSWKREPMPIGSWSAPGRVLEDFVTVLSPDGKEIKSVSILDAFLNSSYAPHLEHLKDPFDVLHTNTIRPIDGRLAGDYPMFEKGQLLLSMREIHTIAVLDLESERITWALTGQWKFQHEPRLLENGNILLFDNRGNRGRSQILELDPLTQEISWRYRGQPPEAFHSKYIGSVQRLPNGNTLITESLKGRAFEVTVDGTIVWEYFNPNRTGENDELIANLYDVIRLDDEDVAWLGGQSGSD